MFAASVNEGNLFTAGYLIFFFGIPRLRKKPFDSFRDEIFYDAAKQR